MSSIEPTTIRSIFNNVLKHVGQVRAKSYELLLALALIDETTDEDDQKIAEIKRIFDELDAAKNYLDVDLTIAIKSSSTKFPDEVNNLITEASNEIEKFEFDCKKALASSQAGAFGRNDLMKLEINADSSMRPVIGSLIKAMGVFVDENEGTKTMKDRELIADAIAQIDYISTSINLISVNASVEAARAGEVGKGFAVIAAEIQNLSLQSKQAVEGIRAGLQT